MSWADCRRITRENAKSFYFASFPLPRHKRDATYATYAFCRVADDVVDDAKPGEEQAARDELRKLRLMLDGIAAGRNPQHPLWSPFAETVARFGVPVETFHALLDGVESDLAVRRFASFDELRRYCYQVASTVGVALSHIFGFEDEDALDYAANMGIAMQLTNIVRDVGADLDLGRVYLPLDELAAFGLDEDALHARVVTDPFRQLLRFQIARAREFYRRAFRGIRFLTRDGSHWTAYLMGDVYRSILDDVERNDFDVFNRRASISLGRKISRAVTAPLRFPQEVLQETSPIMHLPEPIRE